MGLAVPPRRTVSALINLFAEILSVDVNRICLSASGELFSDVGQCVLIVPGEICVEIKPAPPRIVADCSKDFGSMKEIRRLGQGAFGVVTLIEDQQTHDMIALKSIPVNTSSDSDKVSQTS
jgi:hypothetical protein